MFVYGQVLIKQRRISLIQALQSTHNCEPPPHN